MPISKKNKSSEHYFSSLPKCDDSFGLIRAKLRGRNFEFLTSSSVFSKKHVDLGTNVLIDAMVLPNPSFMVETTLDAGRVVKARNTATIKSAINALSLTFDVR